MQASEFINGTNANRTKIWFNDGAANFTPTAIVFGSVQIGIDKANTAALFRRPSKVFEDRANSGGANVLSLRGVTASEGGIPLMRDGKVIGAIGCSGGTSAQDGQACKAGADTMK